MPKASDRRGLTRSITAASSFRALVPAAGAGVVLLVPLEMEWHARSALAIATAMILCWIMELLHPALVGFIGCFLFRAVGDVEFEDAFAGFSTETPWFLYGALLLFGAANRSGLVGWLSARTPRAFASSRLPATVVLIALAYALSFAVPSSLARATILAIMAMAWSRTSEPRNPGTSEPRMLDPWLVLVAAYAASMFGHPEMAGGPLSIVGWDVVAAIAVVAAVTWLSKVASDTGSPVASAVDLKRAAPVILAVALWLTTPVHGVSPALVGLACGLLCSVPGLAPAGLHLLNMDHLAVVFVGTAISIPPVLIETKAVEALSHAWLDMNQWLGVLPADLVGYWTTTVYRMFSPEGARPALPSLAEPLGSTAIWSYAGSTLLSLHQAPALVLAMSVCGCRPRHVLTVGLSVIILGSVVVMLS